MASVGYFGQLYQVVSGYVQVRVLCGRAALTFWFQVSKYRAEDPTLVLCQA